MCQHCLRRCTAKDWRALMIIRVASTSVLVTLKQISTVAMEPILKTTESKCCRANWLVCTVTPTTMQLSEKCKRVKLVEISLNCNRLECLTLIIVNSNYIFESRFITQ